MRGALATVALVWVSACAPATQYTPRAGAPGELTLSYNKGFHMQAGGRPVAKAYDWRGLHDFVRCVPKAEKLAARAEKAGAMAVGFSVAGGVLGGVALGTLPALAIVNDSRYTPYMLLSGIVVAGIGTLFAGLGRSFKNEANGTAVDAMNYYNDAAGSFGESCMTVEQPASLPND